MARSHRHFLFVDRTHGSAASCRALSEGAKRGESPPHVRRGGPWETPVDIACRSWYIGNMVTIERIQTGVRMEKRLVKVLKAIAEYHDMSLGDLLEGIVLHAFEGKAPFGAESLRKIAELKKIYALELNASQAPKLVEANPAQRPVRRSQ